MLFKQREVSEQKLIEGLKKGSGKYERLLYQKYSEPLFNVCIQYSNNIPDAEDLLHDSFIRIYEKISGFESRFNGGLLMWMRRIVINMAINKYRELKKIEVTDNFGEHTLTEDYHDFSIEDQGYSYEDVFQAIKSLPVGYQLVFNLYVLEGMKHHQIAEELSISVNTSKTQLLKARKKLINILSQSKQA